MSSANPVESFDVVIAGAGVGGAACALALAHDYPLRILVLERQAGPGKINRGDSLLPAVTAQLAEWNALDRFRAAGARPLAKMQVWHYRAGLLLDSRLDDLDGSAPYLVLPHPEIERTLIEAAQATARVEVRYGCQVTRLLFEGNRVRGVAASGDKSGEQLIHAGLLIGADGSNSTVRSALRISFCRVPYKHSYFGLEMERPKTYEDAMRIELHPAGGILVVPNPSLDRVGLGVLVYPPEEELFRSGVLEAKVAAIQQRSPLFASCRAFPRGAHLYKLSRFHAAHYAAHGAALLGDAVHITNPTAGQGMTMAIEDAAALARHVGPALASGKRGPVLDAALQAYERERRPLNAALIRW